MANREEVFQGKVDVHILNSRFKITFLQAAESMDGIGSVLFWRDLFQGFPILGYTGEEEEDYMSCVDCCNWIWLWDGHPTRMPFFKRIYIFTQRTGTSSPEAVLFGMTVMLMVQSLIFTGVHRQNRNDNNEYCTCGINCPRGVNKLFW